MNEQSAHKFLDTQHKKPLGEKAKKHLPGPAKKALKPAVKFYRRRPKMVLSTVVVVEIIFIILFSISIWGLVRTSGAKDVSDQFIAYLKTDEVNAALPLVSQEFRRQDLSNFMNPIASELAGDSSLYKRGPLKNVGGASDYAIIYKMPTTSGGTFYVKVVLGQQGSSWRIKDLKSSSEPLKVN